MRLYLNKRLQRTARFLLVVMLLNILQPLGALALTSGPSQPEAMSFQPVGLTDMVDLFTGDFKYNIPLLDIDGYPINLNYQSGSGMDDEASWVGLGWNLNVGSINRQVRGIPDDADGDVVKTEHSTKPKVTIGGRVTATAEFKGIGKNGKVGGSFSLGVFNDNYTGIGAEIGVNAGLSFGLNSTGSLTAGMGLGILSNTSTGVDISPYVSLSLIDKKNEDKARSSGLSTSLTYNSRSGMKSLTLGQSYTEMKSSLSTFGASWSYNTGPVMPKIQVPYFSDYSSFSFSAGPAAVGFYFGLGGTGYRSVREVLNTTMENPGYGFLYADRAKDRANAVHDFTREKDNPIIPELPNLAMPIHTPDMFNYNSQKGSGQFRLFRATGMLGDNKATDASRNFSLGIEAGGGWIVHGGISLYQQDAYTTTRKWVTENNYAKNGDFQSYDKNSPKKENVYFRKVDEKVREDEALVEKMGGTDAVAVDINGKTAENYFNKKGNGKAINQVIEKTDRQLKKTNISYLTAKEAKFQGLEKKIENYPFLSNHDSPGQWGWMARESNQVIKRERVVANEKQESHISEIVVTEADNSRQVYGIPVYNTKQKEYSFAIGKPSTQVGQGYQWVTPTGESTNAPTNLALVSLKNNEINHKNGIDEYYHVDHQVPHASSYLLTAILSPDYVDKTGDGITDDDMGTAIKFNYSKLVNNYKWRTPYVNQGNTSRIAVTVNRGLLADPDDDKGSFIYGEREVYHPQSIETKTHIAIFITADRQDAFGVTNEWGQRDTGNPQKKLMEIRLYAKTDLYTPIKVVKFKYDYLLCKDTPNAGGTDNPNGKKLTLTGLWFEYGKTDKGKYNPYTFTYHETVNNQTLTYANMATDRWGTYKPAGANTLSAMNNEEFPYSTQDRNKASSHVAAFQLKEIGLPSGGTIAVNYEADDYAYVQNKRASVIKPILGFIGGDRGANDLRDKTGLAVEVDELPPDGADHTKWFMDRYLNGTPYLYTKAYIKFSTSNGLSEGQDFDYVSAYGKVQGVRVITEGGIKKAEVTFEQISDKKTENPILFAAWQKMKNEYPRYAYPGFKNKTSAESAGQAIQAAVSAIVNAAGNLSELKQNFYEKAYNRGFASEVVPQKCFVRLADPKGTKIGGGLRVKYIAIKDDWQTMSGEGQQVTGATYGQWYDYTLTENGQRISSGVATYEPAVGSDENSLRQPVFYSHKVKGGLSDMFELELPFGESLYPSPSVGYRKVSVRDLKPGLVEPQMNIELSGPRTGTTVHEFYTAKEFPVRVQALTMKHFNDKPAQQLSMFASNNVEELILSQGYSIELNDMHGKMKASRTFNQGGTEISATQYEYQVEDPNAQELKLKNEVEVIASNGEVSHQKVLGRDVELFTDFREQEYHNRGTTLNPGLDGFAAWIVPVIFVYSIFAQNNEYRLFRSTVATKVVHNAGILKKVIKTEDGSSSFTENIAYDELTGEAVVTRTQNEFNQFVYTISEPAYWWFGMMGGAYRNLGMVLSDVKLDANGEINSAYFNLVEQGTMLINLADNQRYWVVNARTQPGDPSLPGAKKLINQNGILVNSFPDGTNLKVWRSSYNNKLMEVRASLVCLENPIKDGWLLGKNIDLSNYKVLQASQATFEDVWPVDGNGEWEGYEVNAKGAGYFALKQGSSSTGYGGLKVRFHTPCGSNPAIPCWQAEVPYDHTYLNTRLNACGIWIDDDFDKTVNRRLGIEANFDVSQDKTYSIGLGGDNEARVWIDGKLLVDLGSPDGYRFWNVYPLELTTGTHHIKIEGKNHTGYNNYADNPCTLGAEVYFQDPTALKTASQVTTIFTTASFRGFPSSSLKQPLNVFREETPGGTMQYYKSYFIGYNPFVHGMLGNWRPSAQYVYQGKRSQAHLSSTQKGADVAQAGYFEHFFNSWQNNSSWVKANQVTQYDKYGQELENRDALGRYSAAKFDFKGQLPAIVANNAQNKDVFHETFEDFDYGSAQGKQRFTAGTSANDVLGPIVTLEAPSHTGLRAGRMQAGKVYKLSTAFHNQERGPWVSYFTRDDKKQFQLIKNVKGLYPNGFEPWQKQYLFSAWIRDNNKETKANTLKLTYKGKSTSGTTTIEPATKAVVEGWKLVEGVMNLETLTDTEIEIGLSNSVDTWIDDIRIHPKEAMAKTYAYNNRSFKLMAELDENNFATFYEYDDEGQLVRVKKETERGIVTLKETRAVYRKRNAIGR